MSAIQGLTLLWVKRATLVVVTLHGVEGARRDADGIWHGLDEIDRDTYRALEDWDGDGERLREFLQRALLASRYLVPVPQDWIERGAGADQKEQNALLAAAFGASSARSIFTGMKSFIADRKLDEVSFIPKRRGRGGIFEGFDPRWSEGHEDVVIQWNDAPEVWLDAVRLCLKRCL